VPELATAPAPRGAPTSRAADPRPACALVAGYLAAAAAPLVAAALGGGPAALVARQALPAHLALLAVTAWGARVRGGGRRAAAAAWAPLVAIPLLYAGLPAVAAAVAAAAGRLTPGGLAPMHDAAVIARELALFGGTSPAVTLARRWPVRPISELLHVGYLLYYLVIYLPPLLLWRAGRRDPGRRRAFAASVFAVMLAFVLCYLVFAAFPVQGPWYTWPRPDAVPDGPTRALVERLLAAGASRGTAFPSSHVAVSVAQTLALGRVAPGLAAPAAAATALLALGAVYGGFHYGVDALAGAAVGIAAGVAGPRLWHRAAGRPAPPGIGGRRAVHRRTRHASRPQAPRGPIRRADHAGRRRGRASRPPPPAVRRVPAPDTTRAPGARPRRAPPRRATRARRAPGRQSSTTSAAAPVGPSRA
jgi:membrane-associated phospholipid phosphatase